MNLLLELRIHELLPFRFSKSVIVICCALPCSKLNWRTFIYSYHLSLNVRSTMQGSIVHCTQCTSVYLRTFISPIAKNYGNHFERGKHCCFRNEKPILKNIGPGPPILFNCIIPLNMISYKK